MKKLISYTLSSGHEKWKNSLEKEQAIFYLNKQVSSSLKCGWAKNDIIIATNFNYELFNIKSFNIEGEFKNQVGCCLSKYIALDWAIERFGENLWVNDHDNFQFQTFETKYIDKILEKYDIYCSGQIKKIKPERNKIEWSDLSIFFSPRCGAHLKEFLNINKNLNLSKGSGFKAAKFFLNKIPNKVLMVNYYKYPYRFNIASENQEAWKSRISKFEKNKIKPFCIHGKIETSGFKNACDYLGVDI